MKHSDEISKLTRRQKADLLTGKDFWTTLSIDEIRLPSAWLSDGPSGVRKQIADSDHLGLNPSIAATCLPSSASIANSWNEELVERAGELLGQEAAAQSVSMLLGPGINIKRNPLCGRNFEYYSEDPYLAGKVAAAYIRGIQKSGIYSCVKHFAANNQELRRMVVDSVVDERALREIYLTAFEIAIKEGKVKAVMSAYNRVNGMFANENPHILKEILRDEWGFDGVVVTDWAGCNDRVEGLKCGNELEMPSCRYGADDVYSALEDGSLDESVVDECLDRLIEFVRSTTEVLSETVKTFDADAHHQLAIKFAEESAVLLKNDDVLPLGDKERVCFIGDFAEKPRYQGAGSSVVQPTRLDSFIKDVENYPINYIGYAPGFKRYGGKSGGLQRAALALAKKADTIVYFMGLDEVTEAEGLDRRNMKLPNNQILLLKKLIATGKKVAVILFCGSPVELGDVSAAQAVIHAYLGGQAGVLAMLNILTGEVNPSGKLAESYPYKYSDCSSASNFPGYRMTTQYRESIFVGYRYYLTAGVDVCYPFGYGLSYTTFEYSNLKVDNNGVSFTIKNTGTVAGAETAQLYISKLDSVIFRPAAELKGFKKVFLNPGESKKVSINFDEYTFRVYNPKANCWQVEGGEYDVKIGASSLDIRLQGKIEREGNLTDFGYNKETMSAYFSGQAADVDDVQFELLLGREIPKDEYNFYKKKRMVIHENCTVDDLRYSKRWVGRLFSGGVRFAIGFLKAIGKRSTANMLIQGVQHMPVRGLAKYGGMSRRQMEALLMIFNGHLFKGLSRFLSKEIKEKGEK